MYQKYALFLKQKVLFVMYCVEVLLHEYTHNLNGKKNYYVSFTNLGGMRYTNLGGGWKHISI
jgi:hypothetical protein